MFLFERGAVRFMVVVLSMKDHFADLTPLVFEQEP